MGHLVHLAFNWMEQVHGNLSSCLPISLTPGLLTPAFHVCRTGSFKFSVAKGCCLLNFFQ